MSLHFNAKHGKYLSKTYASYRAMIQRVTDKNHPGYENWGGRGISICDRWLDPDYGVLNFFADMGERPEGMTLDRVDVDGDYCPDNCRWVTLSEQNYNQTKKVSNTSGRTGVSWNKEKAKWEAYISKDKKTFKLGYFSAFEEAVKAREEAEIRLYGYNKQ